jgi:hypothetical protein
MVEHPCKKCGLIFNKKSHLIQHHNKKKSCQEESLKIQKNPKKSLKIQNNPNLNPEKNNEHINTNKCINANEYINSNIDSNINECMDTNCSKITRTEPICPYCSNTFYQISNLNKHIKTSCKVKKQQDEKKEEIFKQLLVKEQMLKEKDEIIKDQQEKFNMLFEQNLKLIEKIDKMTFSNNTKTQKSIKTTNHIDNSTITTNTTNTNNGVIFNLVNYGKEDLNKIDTKHFINNIVKNNKASGVKIPEEILKLIHFNPDYPELNNIYISDINREKCMVWDDGMWKLSTDDKIPEVIDKVVKYSYDKQDELREKYSNNKPFIERLNVINKYTKLNDVQHVDVLKEEQELNDVDNSEQIKRCEDFQKKTYDIFKTTMYNEGQKIKKNKKLLNY